MSHYVVGTTLGWGLKPTRVFKDAKTLDTFIVSGDSILSPERYGPDGWPLDEHGNKLPIYEDYMRKRVRFTRWTRMRAKIRRTTRRYR